MIVRKFNRVGGFHGDELDAIEICEDNSYRFLRADGAEAQWIHQPDDREFPPHYTFEFAERQVAAGHWEEVHA